MPTIHGQDTTIVHEPKQLDFVPTTISLNPHPLVTSFRSPIVKPNRVLISSGWILRGLKYDSPIDEFSALIPFDKRAFDPYTVSGFNTSITRNYLLIKD